jgi:hypothetical protein
MKKITILLAFIGMIALQGCTVQDNNPVNNVDNDTISEVFELRNVNFGYDNVYGYNIYQTLNPQLFPADVLLIYRLSGTINPSTPIWQQIPRTLYLNEGELDYDFDFSKQDFTIYAGGTYDLSLTPSYITNETFRIVIVPGYLSNKMAGKVDLSDYNAVIKAFNIDDSKVKVLNK